MEIVLRAKGVVKSFETPVIDGWDLEIEKGERVFLFGPSGCGKTTFLKMIAGILEPDAGILEVSASRVGFVFQDDRLIPWKSALGNVAFVCGDREKALETLKLVRLEDFMHKLPSELSGGQRQRVNLARALAIEPDLLILDEPFSSLDIHVKIRIMEDLLDVWKERRFTLLGVTHDPDEAVALADRILVLSSPPSKIVDEVRVEDGEAAKKRLIEDAMEYFVVECPGK